MTILTQTNLLKILVSFFWNSSLPYQQTFYTCSSEQIPLWMLI
jgi:hypothetical protein